MIEEDELDYFKLQLKHLEESGNFDVEKYKKSLDFYKDYYDNSNI